MLCASAQNVNRTTSFAFQHRATYTEIMPRPKKPRYCRKFTGFNLFKPAGIPLSQIEIVEIGLDELEALALCDFEGLHQEQAADTMDVSRGTVQRLLQSGRKHVLDVLIHGKALAIRESDHVHIRPPHLAGQGRGRRHGRGRCASLPKNRRDGKPATQEAQQS
jgi:predicted DNA-binding protein (UPF0251 family)